MKKVSACTLDCPDTCSWLVDVEKRTLRGNPEHPFTAGFACRKGSRFFRRLDSKDRITQPLMRTDAGFTPVSWDKALELCALKISSLRDQPEKMLHIRGGGYRGIMARASGAFFEALCSSRTSGSPCDEAGCEACVMDFGALMHNDPQDILNAARIVNWGKDLSRSSTHLTRLVGMARKKGVPVLTISIGGDSNAAISDKMVRIRPGTDRFFAAAVLAILDQEHKLDSCAVEKMANLPQFMQRVRAYSVEELLARCDATRDDAELIAHWLTAEGPAATLIGWGVQRYLHGGSNIRYINAAVTLSGNVGVSGGGVYFNIPSGRVFRKWKARGADSSLAGPLKRRALPLHDLGTALGEAEPTIEFIWIDGMNCVNQLPDSLKIASELLRADFTVVVDGFMNDTAMRADLILPPALILEKMEIVGSCLHRYVNVSHKLLEPRGQCRSEYDILADLGARLVPPVSFPSPKECVEFSLAGSGISVPELMERGFARTGEPDIAFENMNFSHPDGLYRLPENLPEEPMDDPEYPLHLLTLLRGGFLHSQIPESEQSGLPCVYISSENQALQTIMADAGDDVWLSTLQGSMQVRVECVQGLHPDTVIMRRGGWMKTGNNPNILIEPMETDLGGGIAYYSQKARLERR